MVKDAELKAINLRPLFHRVMAARHRLEKSPNSTDRADGKKRRRS